MGVFRSYINGENPPALLVSVWLTPARPRLLKKFRREPAKILRRRALASRGTWVLGKVIVGDPQ